MKAIVRAVSLGCVLLAGCQRVQPRDGTRLFATDEVTEDTCKVDGVAPRDGEFTVLNQGDGKLIIDPEDGTDPFVCTLDGEAFDCPERLQSREDVSGFDAVLIVHVTAEGAFDSDDQASGVQNGRIDCEGSDCDALAASVGTSVPCMISATFEASYVGD